MKVKHVSATDLKRNTADILNAVIFGGVEMIIERHGEIVAKMTPTHRRDRRDDLAARAKRFYGAIPTFPNVSTSRHFRKRSVNISYEEYS